VQRRRIKREEYPTEPVESFLLSKDEPLLTFKARVIQPYTENVLPALTLCLLWNLESGIKQKSPKKSLF